jgi:hypothetical protein
MKERELLDNSQGKTFSACLFNVKTDGASTMSYSISSVNSVNSEAAAVGLLTMNAEVFDCAETDVSRLTTQRAKRETDFTCLYLCPSCSLVLHFFIVIT